MSAFKGLKEERGLPKRLKRRQRCRRKAGAQRKQNFKKEEVCGEWGNNNDALLHPSWDRNLTPFLFLSSFFVYTCLCTSSENAVIQHLRKALQDPLATCPLEAPEPCCQAGLHPQLIADHPAQPPGTEQGQVIHVCCLNCQSLPAFLMFTSSPTSLTFRRESTGQGWS